MFKCLQFIEESLRQLNEADEMPMDDDMSMEEGGGDDMGGGEEAPAPEEGGEMGGEAASDPSQIADVDQGQFVSNLGDAEYASIMIRALASNPAFKDKIPQEFLNAQTTENAQQIIQFVKNMVGLLNSGGDTGFNNMSDEEVMSMPV